jgi:hypothetical protein
MTIEAVVANFGQRSPPLSVLPKRLIASSGTLALLSGFNPAALAAFRIKDYA